MINYRPRRPRRPQMNLRQNQKNQKNVLIAVIWLTHTTRILTQVAAVAVEKFNSEIPSI